MQTYKAYVSDYTGLPSCGCNLNGLNSVWLFFWMHNLACIVLPPVQSNYYPAFFSQGADTPNAFDEH